MIFSHTETLWGAASEEHYSNARKSKWYLENLEKHTPISELCKQDKDQDKSERTLENLLNKANWCPKVSVLLNKRKKKKNTENHYP